MAANRLEQGKVRVGIIGGFFDKAVNLERAARPLVAAGHEICVFESKAIMRSGPRTLAEAEQFVEDKDVLVGASFGGLVALVVGFGKTPRRIFTLSSPLHRPRGREYSLQSRGITTASRSLRFMRDEFYRRRIPQRLDQTDQEIIIVTGTEDEIVPPHYSRLDGYRPDMTHIRYFRYTTPPKEVRKGWAHTHTTRKIYGETFFQRLVAGEPLPALV